MQCSEAIRVVAYHFPTASITAMMIMSNMIIENGSYCDKGTANIIIALLVIIGVFTFLVRFTDSYKASNGIVYTVILIPFRGPLCSGLPTEADKDVVWDNYSLTLGDYVQSAVATLVFIGISLFMNPMDACLFPAYHSAPAPPGEIGPDTPNHDGHTYRMNGQSQFGGSLVSFGPILFVLLGTYWFTCIRPTRQMLGHTNIKDTVEPLLTAMPVGGLNNNAAYSEQGDGYNGGGGGGYDGDGSVLGGSQDPYNGGTDGGGGDGGGDGAYFGRSKRGVDYPIDDGGYYGRKDGGGGSGYRGSIRAQPGGDFGNARGGDEERGYDGRDGGGYSDGPPPPRARTPPLRTPPLSPRQQGGGGGGMTAGRPAEASLQIQQQQGPTRAATAQRTMSGDYPAASDAQRPFSASSGGAGPSTPPPYHRGGGTAGGTSQRIDDEYYEQPPQRKMQSQRY